MDSILKDLRYGLRQLRANPMFTLVAVLSLALGIGANTAIFQLIDAVRLRALPVEKPQELAYIDWAPHSMRSGNFSTRSARLTYAQWEQIQQHSEPFSGVIAWSAKQFNLASGGEARYAEGLFVSGDFFRVLGVGPAIGRVIDTRDDAPGCGSPNAVLSYAFWQREFGGDAGAIGKTLRLEGHAVTIIGVTPPTFFGVEVGHRYDVAVPVCSDPYFEEDGKGRIPVHRAWWLSAMGRLKPGWSIERADSYIQAQSAGITQATLPETYRPEDAKRFLQNKLTVTPGNIGVSGLRREYENPLWLLLATTGLVLLIACANLANLLLARASVREREIAVRQAIGASRGRLIAQLLSESLMLALLGTALGAVIATALSRALVAFLATGDQTMFVGLDIDWKVLGFMAGIAVLTCLLFGLAPAIRATRIALSSAMRAAGRGLTAGKERFSLRRGLVIAQVAMSLMLMVGAFLFVRSLQKILEIQPGFRPEGIISVQVDASQAHFSKERLQTLYKELMDRIQQRTGASSIARCGWTPVAGSGWDENAWEDGTSNKHQDIFIQPVSGGYFKTMQTGFLAGRDFDDRDTSGSPKVAIVNETFAKKIFGGANPIGKVFKLEGEAGRPDRPIQVVGLVRDTKYYELREDFLPISFIAKSQDQEPDQGATFVLRTNAAPAGVFRAATAAVAEVNPAIGVEFKILSKQLEASLLRDRLMATLAGAFGVLAGTLAVLGLYGVIAYMVARRRNEIGVRIALGASRGRVVQLVLNEALVLLAAGLAIGIGLSIWAGRGAATVLYDLKPWDPVALGGAAALLAAVALLASYVPARRAARLDPMTALRED